MLGEAISEQIRRHHRRRLRRLGWEQALDGERVGWVVGDPPPRAGNAIDLLIDGVEALPAIARESEAARSHVHMTGWFFSPDFALSRGERPVVLRHLLAELAERVDVRLLVWAGAPLPLFRPSRREVAKMRDALTKQSRIQCSLDTKERPLHCHHEKTIVIDDRVAFVGGIDLTTQAGDRFDTNDHPARGTIGWHDATARIEGPAVTDVAEHFRMRWHEVNDEELAPVAPSESVGDVELQIVRTVPERVPTLFPGRFSHPGVLHFGAAQRRAVHLRGEPVPLVAGDRPPASRKTHRPAAPDFRMLFVLPANPKSGNDDTRGVLAELIEADDNAGRILACALYARSGLRADPIYVHAKIAIVDDRWLTLGSANLNEHPLFNDTEMNVVAHDRALARQTRQRLWAEHLELPADKIPDDPVRAIDELWKPISKEQLERRAGGLPLTHRLVRLPHVSRRTRRILGPIDSLVVDG